MGISDDWSYIRTAQVLAQTGHIVYNGWATAMLGWQLYLAAAFIRLFGPSFTVVRMSTLLVGMVTAFLAERIFVRSGVRERNAVIATLALVLSPLYMMLSVTFMTDMSGLFVVIVCVYGCIRALQAATPRAAAGWVCFSALTNAVGGSSRQIAWLGVLVIVPCTLWLLRRSRQVLAIGVLATLAGWAFIAFCMHWFPRQPYSIGEPVLVPVAGLHQAAYMVRELLRFLLEIPLLALPVLVAFLPQLRRSGRRGWTIFAVGIIGYTLLAFRMAKAHGPTAMLEPFIGDWLGPQGFYGYTLLASEGPVVLGFGVRVVLTALSIAGLLALVVFLLRSPKLPVAPPPPSLAARPAALPTLSWKQIGFLLGPFAAAYFALLVPRSRGWLFDRYLLEFTFVALLCLTRAYQQFLAPRLPSVTVALVAVTALYGIGCTHDMFALYRARIALANQLQAAGVPDNTIDGGYEYNFQVELERGGHVNDERLTNPPNSYVPLDKYRGFTCQVHSAVGPGNDLTPQQRFKFELSQETDPRLLHFAPLYGVAYEPDACRGPAPFAPVRYFRWLGFQSTKLYVVKFGPR